ncbi:phage portal protein [Streptomyces marianii]|uniref:phage portal protein n=1 Tax=Streptomyces marianii TaxID=1817406 RepID=UPI001487462B|nr:phage portal protein [Streptomyces marianii]
MSVFRRGRAARAPERRNFPALPLDQVLAQLKGSSGYAHVDLSAAESSLQSVAVYAATDLIASIVSELPADVFRGKGPDRKELATPWWLEDPDGSGYGREDWVYRCVMSWLLRGNVYGEELQRATAGFLQQVELFHPDKVSGSVEDGEVHWLVNGSTIPSGQFVHRRVNPVAGVVKGLSPIQLVASTIGLSLTSTKFGLQWFQDGAHPNALLVNSESNLDEDQAAKVKQKFMAALRGTREPVVFGKGWDYRPLQIAPEESQFLETQKYSQAECARIFGPGIAEILGYGSGSMTYSNIVDRDISLLKYAVGKWVRRTERFLSQFLPRPQYVKLNRDALLETNTMQRYLAHASALGSNWETINEVRALEDRPPVAWGDAPFTPGPAAGDTEPAEDDPEQEE